jgi:hypothetical protein
MDNLRDLGQRILTQLDDYGFFIVEKSNFALSDTVFALVRKSYRLVEIKDLSRKPQLIRINGYKNANQI